MIFLEGAPSIVVFLTHENESKHFMSNLATFVLYEHKLERVILMSIFGDILFSFYARSYTT